MRIISDFKDYYDSLRSQDTDRLHVYHRKKVEIPVYDVPEKNGIILNTRLWSRELGRYTMHLHTYKMFIVGFCGKMYFGLHYVYNSNLVSIRYFDEQGFRKEIDLIVDRHGGKEKFKKYPRWYRVAEKEEKSELDKLFSTENLKPLAEVFVKYKVPAFVYAYNGEIGLHARYKLTLNPCLKDYEFFQAVVPYNAYQEIAMYVGNNLVEDPNKAWPIEDKLKAQAHGFDKYSFRKPPAAK